MWLGVFVVLVGAQVEAGRVLGVFPHPGLSHFLVFRPLLEGLALRGHEVTVISHFPRPTSLPNYTDISLTSVTPDYNGNLDMTSFDREPSTFASNVKQLYNYLEFYEPVLRMEEVRGVTGEEWDLVLTEAFNTDLFLGLVHKLGAPFLALSSCAVLPWFNARFGNPEELSYIPGIFSPFHSPMSLLERLSNAGRVWVSRAAYALLFEPYSQRLAEKYLGPLPPLSEVASDTSLLLVNTHHSLHRPRPLSPSVIEIGGIHIPPPSPLPQELKKLLNESTQGVIYFSMGSLLRGSTLSQGKKESFLKAFARLNQRVLWKWEEHIPGKPENVLTRKWYPQSDVLAHPNVVLFITHGGLLSVSEAAHFGVPTVGIPMFGDQEMNVKAMVSTGAGVELPFYQLTEENLYDAIHTVLNNPRFKKSAQILSTNFRDRPMSPLDTAIFWTEYVMRHKGTPFLQPASVHLNFYQYYFLDAILLLICAVITFYVIIKYCCKYLLKTLCKRKLKQS